MVLLLLPGSSFGSVMCMYGGEAGEEQEQHFTSRAVHQIYRCDQVIVFKGLFFRIDEIF